MILDFLIFGMQPAMILWSPWVVARRSSCINSSRKPAGAGMPHEKTAPQRCIEATDGQIDGGPALWADGGGDSDRGRCQKIATG
jgi:hypothetical protein